MQRRRQAGAATTTFAMPYIKNRCTETEYISTFFSTKNEAAAAAERRQQQQRHRR